MMKDCEDRDQSLVSWIRIKDLGQGLGLSILIEDGNWDQGS